MKYQTQMTENHRKNQHFLQAETQPAGHYTAKDHRSNMSPDIHTELCIWPHKTFALGKEQQRRHIANQVTYLIFYLILYTK